MVPPVIVQVGKHPGMSTIVLIGNVMSGTTCCAVLGPGRITMPKLKKQLKNCQLLFIMIAGGTLL